MGYRVLLTGATGALGPSLSSELLHTGAAETLSVMLREPSPDRFAQWLGHVEPDLPPRLAAERISPVRFDLRPDDLGIDPDDLQRITRESEVIVHAAADTRFRGPPGEQWTVNVDGTRRMLDLARRCRRLRKFILVSTVCVSGTRTGLIDETLPDDPPGFVNHYERTKWEAERIALRSGLPVEVARLSIVSGSSSTGAVYRQGALHHVLRWFGRGLIPRVPGTPQTRVDLIASETAARLLARAASSDPQPGTIWHIAAGRAAVPLTELMRFTWEQMRPGAEVEDDPPRVVDEADFEQYRRSLDPSRQRVLAQAVQSIETFLPALLYPRQYDTTAAEALWGGPLPLYDWKQTLARVIRSGHPHARRSTARADAA